MLNKVLELKNSLLKDILSYEENVSNYEEKDINENLGRVKKSIEILKSFFDINELYVVIISEKDKLNMKTYSFRVLTRDDVFANFIRPENFDYDFQYPAINEIITFTSNMSDEKYIVRITIKRII